MDNIIYARLDGKQFKAVNTAKGPWSLLSSFENTNETFDMHANDQRNPMSVPTRASCSLLRVSTSNLLDVTNVIYQTAISFIGSDNFEGKIFALRISHQDVILLVDLLTTKGSCAFIKNDRIVKSISFLPRKSVVSWCINTTTCERTMHLLVDECSQDRCIYIILEAHYHVKSLKDKQIMGDIIALLQGQTINFQLEALTLCRQWSSQISLQKHLTYNCPVLLCLIIHPLKQLRNI